MNSSAKSFKSVYSKIHKRKFFFYKPTQIAENTLQSLKVKLDANEIIERVGSYCTIGIYLSYSVQASFTL